ncbi:hypothetical protein J6590_017031 [Homalodisca vitripennis]|nr:hypothetical protein J6590_017031 [Homalodisca vitripennis]
MRDTDLIAVEKKNTKLWCSSRYGTVDYDKESNTEGFTRVYESLAGSCVVGMIAYEITYPDRMNTPHSVSSCQ